MEERERTMCASQCGGKRGPIRGNRYGIRPKRAEVMGWMRKRIVFLWREASGCSRLGIYTVHYTHTRIHVSIQHWRDGKVDEEQEV